MKDSFDREITYARISVTDLCNMRCKYCMPDGVEKKSHEDILSIEQLIKVSDALSELGVTKQRITGGEPLVRRGVMDLLGHMGNNPNIKTLGITTNGQLLQETAEDLFNNGVRALNVSLDTLCESKFREVTKLGALDKTLRGIEKAQEVGFTNIKLNAVLLKGVNDCEIKDLADYAKAQKIAIRFIELMPFETQYKFAKDYFISTNDIVKRFNLHYLAEKSTTKKLSLYAFPDGVEVGFISPVSNRFCSECNRIRITADGKLLNCLHERKEYDIKPYLNDSDALKDYVKFCVMQKPKEHHIQSGLLQSRNMENIGG